MNCGSSPTGLDAVSDGISAALQDLWLCLACFPQLQVQQLLQLLRVTPLTHLTTMGNRNSKQTTVAVHCYCKYSSKPYQMDTLEWLTNGYINTKDSSMLFEDEMHKERARACWNNRDWHVHIGNSPKYIMPELSLTSFWFVVYRSESQIRSLVPKYPGDSASARSRHIFFSFKRKRNACIWATAE